MVVLRFLTQLLRRTQHSGEDGIDLEILGQNAIVAGFPAGAASLEVLETSVISEMVIISLACNVI